MKNAKMTAKNVKAHARAGNYARAKELFNLYVWPKGGTLCYDRLNELAEEIAKINAVENAS